MYKLTTLEKNSLIAGAQKFNSSFNKKNKNFFKLNKKKFSTLGKNFNKFAHNSAMVGMSLATTNAIFYEKLLETKEKKQNTGEVGNNPNWNKSKSSLMAMSIRPSLRFSPYPHNSAITFGLPWYF